MGALIAVCAVSTACSGDGKTLTMEGASMQPTLEHGTRLALKEYGGGVPARGDIIAFRSPIGVERKFVKRIIGVPGDTIEINESTGELSVNGSVLEEPYVKGITTCNLSCEQAIPAADTPESKAACGSNACYYVLGDNRQNSSDSRQGWLVPRENIIGYWEN